MIGWIALGLAGFIGVLLVLWVLSLRRIVPPKYADVVTRKEGVAVYSVDTEVTGLDSPQTVYYEWPSWLPWGLIVRRMPLTIIEVPIKHYKTFAKGNARFVADVSVYCKIHNVLEAAKRFPGNSLEDFIEGIREIVVSAIRITTANFTVEEVIAHREQVAKKIEEEIKDDFQKWGVQLTNTAIIDIKDPEDKSSTVVHDISAKKEAEINTLSRKEIAIKDKEARLAEAENLELAKTREIEAQEKIAKREETKKQIVAIEAQKAKEKEMEVIRTQNVEQAKIDAEAMKEKAEGTKKATVITAEGNQQATVLDAKANQQKFEMEGKGQAVATKEVGTAEAEVIKQKGLSEALALDKKAEAQKKQQEFAKAIREIEMEEKVRVELAKAFQAADLKFIGAGNPKTFMDLFSPEGGLAAGAGIGNLLMGLKETDKDTYSKVEKFLTDAGKKLLKDKKTEEKEDGTN